MKFREFDLKASLPFSQGYAINEIAKSVSGRLVAAGESPSADGGNLLYTRFRHSGDVKESEAIWLDACESLRCTHHRVGGGPWMERGVGGEWVCSPIEVVLSGETR